MAKKLNECSIFPPCRLEQSVVERVRLIVVPESSELAVVTIPAPVGVMMEDIPSTPAFTPTHTTSLRKRPQETSATLEERVLCDSAEEGKEETMASVTPFYAEEEAPVSIDIQTPPATNAEEEEPPVTPDIQTTPAANTKEEPLVTPPPISPYVPRGPYAWAKDVTLSSPPPLPAQEGLEDN